MLTKNFKDQELENLMKAVLALDCLDEAYAFFEDLCTINELQAMKQRLQVALLARSGMTYHEIAKETGASSATISRVRRAMDYGSNGYNIVIDRVFTEIHP